MALKLIIVGLPGSGKSAITRHITTYLKEMDWSSIHFSDYLILNEMFRSDRQHKQFKPADHGGFDVLDVAVFDIALQRLEQEINEYLLCAKQEEIVLIEFARNDYLRAFQQFNDAFLQDAHFLHLDVEIRICKRRILERIANPSSKDDFYVSEYIFSTYYTENNGRSIPRILASEYGIEKQRVKVIDNNGSLSDSITQVNQFVDSMCGLEPLLDS